MISFIVVGRNEGRHIAKCLKSIENLILEYSNLGFEIIYVDSKSTDESISQAKLFKNVNVFEITGAINSAIARNIGAKEAKGDILFFVDADMEIQKEFLRYALDKSGNLKFEYITGHLDDYFYTSQGNFFVSQPRTYQTELPHKNQRISQNGGCFLITEKAWEKVGGMKNKFRRSQDLDLAYRLQEKGISIIRIPHLVAFHHTIDYRDQKRMWKKFWHGDEFYPALILKNHIFNIKALKSTFRQKYSAMLLAFVGLLFISNLKILIEFGLLFYLIVITLRTIVDLKKVNSNKNTIGYFLNRYLLQFLKDCCFWIGFLFFFPNDKKLQYKQLK